MSGFSLEVLQPGLLCWNLFKFHTYSRRKKKTPYVFSLPYFRVLPVVCLSMLIVMVYAVVAPLLLPFLIGYFLLGYCVFINQIQDAYLRDMWAILAICTSIYNDLYIPHANNYDWHVWAEVKTSGIYSNNSTALADDNVNEYCKMRFLPSFKKISVQKATENDELDENDGMGESNREVAVNAYRPPFLQPVDFRIVLSSYTEPLLSSVMTVTRMMGILVVRSKGNRGK